MSDRPVEVSPAPSPGGPAGRVAWVGLVVLLDYVAGVLTFGAAGGYLILNALNDRQSLLMPALDWISDWFFTLDLHRMPGLPEYEGLRNFADPSFAFAYLIAMSGLHLLASAGFVALAFGLSAFRPWARRDHIGIASLAILILGGYGFAYARSPSPRFGLAVMGAAAVVPAAVLAILLMPGIAPLFAEDPRPAATAIRSPARGTRQPRLFLIGLLAAYVLGALVTVLILSIPIAIDWKLALAPDA
jgi:hypothetical protein